MFVEDTLTIWVEALQARFDANHPVEQMRNLTVQTEYPMEEAHYPGLWVNFSMQGAVKNVGIGHVEYESVDGGGVKEVFRWHFGGFVEITLAALGNLERARLLDALTADIAVARVDQNNQGILRATIERNDLIGMAVVWESMTLTGFGEAQGTPWGTDDVVYEATVTLAVEGEVVLDPSTGTLVPLSQVVITPVREGEEALPTPGSDGWV